MRKLIAYITGKEWAAFVGVVTALLLNLPAIVELVQANIDDAGGKVEPLSLIVLVATYAVRRKVWSSDSVAGIEAARKAELQSLAVAKQEQDLRLIDLSARELAAGAVLDAARKGLPLPMVDFPKQPE